MAHIVVTLLLSLLSTVALAQQGRVTLVHPQPSELVVLSVSRVNDVNASFGGAMWVTGTVYGRWPAGALNKDSKEPDVLLIPDKAAAAALPYFTITHETGVNRYRVTTIDLVNPLEALRKAVGPDQYRRLLERRVNQVRATGRFRIEDYLVGVECDAPWSRARLIEAELPEQQALRHVPMPQTC